MWKVVNVKIFYGTVLFLFFISTTTVFAESFSVQTDDAIYHEGDTIVISGNVGTVIGETPVIIQVISETRELVDIDQLNVAQDGGFITTVLAEGPKWQNAGEYTVKAVYLDTIETTFSYSPKAVIFQDKTIFEIDAGSHGTFDVEYSISGGTVKDIVVNSDIFGIKIQIDALDEGNIILDLPREFIGAENESGKDVPFIIYIDGVEVPHEEPAVLGESRAITVGFVKGDSEIEIIGTYVVPEFGMIVMMILIAGIMTAVIFSRNKFQIKA